MSNPPDSAVEAAARIVKANRERFMQPAADDRVRIVVERSDLVALEGLSALPKADAVSREAVKNELRRHFAEIHKGAWISSPAVVMQYVDALPSLPTAPAWTEEKLAEAFVVAMAGGEMILRTATARRLAPILARLALAGPKACGTCGGTRTVGATRDDGSPGWGKVPCPACTKPGGEEE